MAHYIALIHKDLDSSYGVSFPDLPGVIAGGESIDEAIAEAAEALAFAAEDWSSLTGQQFPVPRTIDALRDDEDFREAAAEGIVVAVPFGNAVNAAA